MADNTTNIGFEKQIWDLKSTFAADTMTGM